LSLAAERRLVGRREAMTEQDRAFVFLGVLVVLGAVNGAFMWRGSPGAKRAWFPRITILAGVLFAAGTYWVMRHAPTLYFLVPVTVLITLVNLKATKFCAQCGAYNQSFGPFHRVNFCRKCGAALP
jgi:hypothetical protein